MVPIRYVFRSRWAALLWAAGICWTAVSFAGGHDDHVDAANSADGNAAELQAVLADS
jgi:hypothetical protein